MAVLDARRAAVGLTQDRQDLFQGRLVASRETVDHEGALQVPHGEAVVRQVEFGVQGRRLAVQRIEVGVQVSAHPVHVDQFLHANLLQDPLGVAFVQRRIAVRRPARRLVRDAEGREDLVVEIVLTGETLGDELQEQSGLGPLDDPVVVGRGEREYLAHAQFGEGARVGRLEAGRPAQGADAEDRALDRP